MTLPAHFPTSPEHIWNQFYQITQCPRPSKKEEKIREYLVSVAKERNVEHKVDGVGNVIMYVPGTGNKSGDDPLIIQNHMDMVTDAIVGKQIDFNTDPIETCVENGWLKACGTTLGADNGIGCAAALAILFEDQIEHPPLELLFTTDEETGLNGALGLDASLLKGTRMLNLDTEEWGSLYIGCAGGIDYELEKKVDLTPITNKHTYKIELKGLVGGHSGVDIHEQRGNAIKLMTQFLDEAIKLSPFEIIELRGGKAHNIIPREAYAIVAFEREVNLNSLIEDFTTRWKSYLPTNDHKLELTVEKAETTSKESLSASESAKLLQLIQLFPHGVSAYDREAEGEMVSMSNNLAKAIIMNGHCYFQTSLRFFDREEVRELEMKLSSLASIFDYKLTHHSEYPSWKPVRHNKLLDSICGLYEREFGHKAIITAIHAGLECGILRDKIGPIDVVSFGPTITGAHSPDESLEIESVTHFWKLFKTILKEI